MFGLGMNCSLSVLPFGQKKHDQNKGLLEQSNGRICLDSSGVSEILEKTDCRLGVGQFTW